MREFYKNNKNFFDKLILLIAMAAFMALVVFLAGYVAPFVAGFVISLILSPLVGFVHAKTHINRGLIAAVLIIALITAIFFLGRFLVSQIANEIQSFAQDIPHYISNVQYNFENLVDNAEGFLGTDIEIDFSILLNQVLAIATGMLQGMLEGGNIITTIPAAIVRTIIAIVSAFFFIKDKESIKSTITSLFPRRLIVQYNIVRQGILKALLGYVKGQLIVMCCVATIVIFGLVIIGSPYALFVGIGIAVFDLMPIFGAGGILLPWAVYHFLVGNFTFAIGILVIYGVVFITRQILEPRIVGQQMGIHPIVLLMSVYVGLTIMGPIGFLAGPLIALTIKTTMEADLNPKQNINY